MAGVHGCEYSSMAALTRFLRDLDPERLAGSLVGCPIVNQASFRTRTPFVVPGDGKNLNRCFPGDPHGSPTEVLAHEIFDHLVRGADYLIDMHAGDMVEDLAPFALYEEAPVEGSSRQMAVAYGLPYVVRTSRSDAPIGGTASGAAASSGIPAITAEAGGRGLLEEEAVALHLAGLGSVLSHLGVLAAAPSTPAGGRWTVGRFVWVRSAVAGWWEAKVATGQRVGQGELLGVVLDAFGHEVEWILSPEAGVPLFITTSPAVAADGLLLGLGADVRPLD
jgi:predicted deacylase